MQELNQIIKTEADRCVKCGLCLPHCPTYFINKHEGESPRGRIALLENLALGELDLTQQTKNYLDHCLACRACEAVCPVPVHYGKLITKGREWINKKKPKLFSLKKMILFLLPHLSLIRKKYLFQKPMDKREDVFLNPSKTHPLSISSPCQKKSLAFYLAVYTLFLKNKFSPTRLKY